MDALLVSLNYVSTQLIPILGAIALILLAFALKKLGDVLSKAVTIVQQLSTTIDLTNESMKKIQKPLETAEKMSISAMNMQEKFSENVDKMKETLSKGFAHAVDIVNSIIKK